MFREAIQTQRKAQTQEAGPELLESTHHHYLRQPHSGSTGTSTTFKESKCKMGNQDDDRNDQKSEYLYFYLATKNIGTSLFWPKPIELGLCCCTLTFQILHFEM